MSEKESVGTVETELMTSASSRLEDARAEIAELLEQFSRSHPVSDRLYSIKVKIEAALVTLGYGE